MPRHHRRLCAIYAIAALVATLPGVAPGSARADVLAVYDVGFGATGAGDGPSAITLGLYVSPPPGFGARPGEVLSIVVSPADEGLELLWGPADPGFLAVAARLTDGVDEGVVSRYTPEGGGGGISARFESGVFAGARGDGRDMQFGAVTGIHASLPSLSITPTPTGYRMVGRVVYTFLGTPAPPSAVPEPGTLGLCGAGLAGGIVVAVRARRRRAA